MEADVLIKNAMVLTMDEKFSLYETADLAVSGSKIAGLSPQLNPSARKIIDASGKLVMPGLINAHTHAAMVMMRGLADDMPLDIWWREFIFPIEKKLLSPEFIRIGVSLAVIEMLKGGTTAFADMYFFEEVAAEVCKDLGIRAFLGEGILDFPAPDSLNAEATFKMVENMCARWKNDATIHPMVAPHALYSCSQEKLIQAKTLADKFSLPLHLHLAETAGEVADFRRKQGLSPVEFLEKIGLLGENLIAAHCVHLGHNDIELLTRRQVKVVHCQESNMKLASGNAPIIELQDRGVAVAMGTDGAASNNNLDLFDEMNTVAKHHKAIRNDPTVMDAKTVLRMATSEGAKVLQNPGIGSLAVGNTADLIIVDLRRPHLIPLYNIYSQLVYSAGGADVEAAMINGKLVMENRKILTVDEDEVIDRANHLAKKIKAEVH
jgi:5-methylthioadenosine/S-adenosylhomocysteine deaminase